MPKVLIVSATDLFPDLGQTVLWSERVQRVFADSSDAALDVARAFVPSLVVVDGGSLVEAREVIRGLRDSPGARRSSILALARPLGPSMEELEEAGANLALDCPVDPQAWDDRLETLMSVPRRVRLQFPVSVTPSPGEGPGDGPFQARALDLSVRGVLLETNMSLQIGVRLGLRCQLPFDGRDLFAAATVMRASEGTPCYSGVRFDEISHEDRDRILELLATMTPDAHFGRYEVLGLLGEGSMGRVYRAFDPLARRVVAIKTLKPHLLSGPEAEEHRRRFRQEAQAAARLVHPNIVTIFDVGEDYFAMELLDGATLQAVLRERGSLSCRETCRILRPVAEAIDYAHASGTVHRDIKPANIMLPVDGRPKVMDFGVAHLTSSAISSSGEICGSPSYMAPEQITRGDVTHLADVFSLAVVAYEALTGRKPFDGESITPILYNVVNNDPQPVSSWNSGLPKRSDAILQRGLAKQPADRFPSSVAFVAALEAVAPAEAPDAEAEPGSLRPAAGSDAGSDSGGDETVDLSRVAVPARRRLYLRLLAYAGTAAILAVIGGLLWSPPQRAPTRPGLSVFTRPPGASVLLDGRKVGKSPLLVSDVAMGPHTIRVDLENHAPAEIGILVPGEGPPAPVRFTLQPLAATLGIQSDPTPALVSVDGVSVGATPLIAVPLAPGPHQLRVERGGFEAWAETIDARLGETLERRAVLRPIGGSGTATAMQRKGWIERGDLVALGPGVTPPLRISGVPPVYPPAARRLGQRGTVTVEFTVTEDGIVLAPKIVQSADEVLDEAMLQAVGAWRFQPAEASGVQVRVRMRESFRFGDEKD